MEAQIKKNNILSILLPICEFVENDDIGRFKIDEFKEENEWSFDQIRDIKDNYNDLVNDVKKSRLAKVPINAVTIKRMKYRKRNDATLNTTSFRPGRPFNLTEKTPCG